MSLEVATFRFEVTPPVGHSLCGGWIKPVVAVDDPLEAIGFVLFGADLPIVLCSFDWCGILNSAHVVLRERLAAAAGTTPDRVSVHTVHQHNAPFVCLDAQDVVAHHPDLPPIVDLGFWKTCLDRAEEAIRGALQRRQPVSHIATGSAKVDRIASNRRFLNAEGKVKQWRGSSTRDPGLQELPEGLVDPLLRTVTLGTADRVVVSIHHYATHPMSYYGDGRVTSDFAGLARRRLQQEDPSIHRMYFTGCAGNIAPGKYNDGSPQARAELTQRLYDALRRSLEDLSPTKIDRAFWKTSDFLAPPRDGVDGDLLLRQVADSSRSLPFRTRPAMQYAWWQRWKNGQPPITVSSLSLNHATSVHLPGECFIEYQLRLAQAHPDRFMLASAYGDGGPWYIPVAECYPQGGYEVEQAFCEALVDERMSQAIKDVTSDGHA
jgi:hypothetical protein